MKKLILLLAFVCALSVRVSAGEMWSQRESGEIYVMANGNTYTTMVSLPITLPFSRVMVKTRPDVDAANNSVVGTYDFWVKVGSGVREYQYFSRTLDPFMDIVGNSVTGTTYKLETVSVSNTNTAMAIGQWFEWKTWLRLW